MALIDGQPSVLLQNVKKLIQQKVKEQPALVEKFAAILYGSIASEDLIGRNDSDLYGAALSLWKTFNNQQKDGAVIRVFNPEISRHGWESKHTIVEIVVHDMPFLVDSVRMALSRQNISAHFFVHLPLQAKRSEQGSIEDFDKLGAKSKADTRQTVFHIEIDRQTDKAAIDALTDELHSVMEDVSLSVQDWQQVREKLKSVIAALPSDKSQHQQRKDHIDFLNWLVKDNFTFLGYREYKIKPVKGDYRIEGVANTALGLMRRADAKDLMLSELPENARHQALDDSLLILTKTNHKSRVHRPAYIDYVGVKQFNDKGEVVGEHRFIGLYSATLYNNSAADIPLLKSKLAEVMAMSEFTPGTHAYKALLNILETYPRDELIQASPDDLLDVATGVLQMQERDMTRVFMRKDTFGRFVSAMVYVPRERYNTQLRRETQQIFQQFLKTDEPVEFTTFFSESVLARTHYIIRIHDSHVELNVKEIERNLIEAARTWEDKLESALVGVYGEAKGRELARKYVNAFPRGYKEEMLPNDALVDIGKLESLNDEHTLEMLFYQPQEEKANSKAVRLNLFHKDKPIHLSDVLPMLENFGLRVIGETPYPVKSPDGAVSWILNFTMELNCELLNEFEQAQQDFQSSFAKVWAGQLEDDGFNRLILAAGLSGREAALLRAIAKYKRQIGGTFSQNYIETTFSRYPQLARLIVELFNGKFSPSSKVSAKAIEKLEQQITEELEHVANLDDDRIIRRFVDIVHAILRTNYFQPDAAGLEKPYISMKIKPELIPEIPLPVPAFEIFVYSPRVEGVHLRFGKVARGGLRWSDRREDFRTEVLGLVKAQQVKNTVIVPVGAKGGFVCKQLPETGGREAFINEGKACYRTFIRGLLDVTDNIVKGEIVPPSDVVRLDEDDPYLVVAADKGTATFSDISNSISEEYGFWMGDAFASGGSNGYDHKGMGITARGAWESVKRHFREIGIDCQSTDFTCVAIGDMAGDVFGNGMLLSKHIRLQAAFNHMHIFIDPNPDAASSYKERERMFKLTSSTWEDYDKSLISEGGGIFLRSAKSIKLTPQMKKMLGTSKATMTPTELIRACLAMPVDLIWNGGIGTYMKASDESHAEVGDRGTEALRLNGKEFKAKIFGEGGNLGATQRGRIEFAAQGGRINTDFIDNVGGVDCSDNEVNIKILLNALVASGDLTLKQRNALLVDMTDDVARLVIEDCYQQTESISISGLLGADQLKEYTRFIHTLEKDGKLNRELEFLPSDDELSDRMARGQGLTRPELAILTAYGKMVLKEQLVLPEIYENPYFKQELFAAFPEVLQKKYSAEMEQHPLKGEIIATKLANQLVNEMGPNFAQRMREETGSSVAELLLCYAMARDLLDVPSHWDALRALDNKIPSSLQTKLLHQLRRTLRRATRWFLRHRNKALDIQQTLDFFKPAFKELSANLPRFMAEKEMAELDKQFKAYQDKGVPEATARYLAYLSTVFSVMDIAQVADAEQTSLALTAEIYFKLGDSLDLHWFLEQITHQPVANHWQALARASYREELDWQQRSLAAVVVRSCGGACDAEAVIASWLEEHDALLERWRMMLAEFKTTKTHEFAKFSVALRELMLLSHHCEPVKS
ncbi:NAD-glutamate dehydrogenase [Alkalimonas delamerensis]|uniref:NAD-glutamate dehydrogenase n=1 Tax=Alkalimonas delamerensis TaxID=265981 RepID=A0ABT9GNM5_9GAMM|nr:NAD-glutamate dehydrogenase [Alkalimonas delamerensis]MDP4528570.1 NAD-glutamate dehydrogenase [Alkalimonas delamerensis]